MGTSGMSHYLLEYHWDWNSCHNKDRPLVLYLPRPIKSNTPLVYPSGLYSPYSSRSRILILDAALLDNLKQNKNLTIHYLYVYFTSIIL